MNKSVWLYVLILLRCFDIVQTTCNCTWSPWESWTLCDATCGGGTQSRTRSLLCYQDDGSYQEILKKCGLDDARYESQYCNKNCFNGGYFSSYQCVCPDINYGPCCQDVCPTINQCNNRSCSYSYNTMCNECNEDNVIFKRWNGDAECQRMCAWNNHYCWPGTCGNYGLTKDCQCDKGFVKRSTVDDSAINVGETTCQPYTNPDIVTCDVIAIGSNGEKKRATHLTDVYGNYQPVRMDFVMVSEFIVSFNSTRPSFILEEHFGISDTTVYVKIRTKQGSYLHKSSHIQLRDAYPNTSVTPSRFDSGNITVNDTTYNLQNGDALCLEFESKGGGYLKSIDTRSSISGPVSYTKVVNQRTVCYRYDSASPEHCANLGRCFQEPLEIFNRISRTGLTRLHFSGWTDPVQSGELSHTASSIESFEIIVNEVTTSKGILKVNYTKNMFSTRVDVSTNSVQLNLTSDSPRLYCITLEVKDVADNVRQTRRFVLYDTTSFIETQDKMSFRFDSASHATNFNWQTHHNNICLSWKDYFVNKFYLNNQLLNPIEPHPSGSITGVYEQLTGPLPVSGTPNVHGIIQYNMSWKVKNGDFGPEHIVDNFQNQNFCIGLNVSDGQTYTFNVRAIDIINNTLNESRIVYIDRTPPYVSNVTWTLYNYKVDYLKPVMDAAKLIIKLNAFDPHSGLHEIQWEFETDKTSSLRDSVSIRYTGRADSVPCPANSDVCHCPEIGGCVSFNVSLPLSNLAASGIHIGQFTGNYSLTIKAINKALLATSETFTISVDRTIPEGGNINTNLKANNNESSVNLQWGGFKDNESGILFSRIYLSDHCLEENEVQFDSALVQYVTDIKEATGSIEIPRDFVGSRIVTVVAYNGALAASLPVCSDVIVGLNSLESQTEDLTTRSPTKTIAVASSISGLAIVGAIAIAAVILVRRKREKTESEERDFVQRSDAYQGVTNQSDGQEEGDEHIYETYDTHVASNPVSYEMDRITPNAAVLCPTANTSNHNRRNAEAVNTDTGSLQNNEIVYQNLF